jgi:hypothetical protein
MVDMGAPDYFTYYSKRPERLFAQAPPLDLVALGAALDHDTTDAYKDNL